MKAYYFVRSEDADEIAECGLKLLAGDYRPADVCQGSKEGCFVTKLNPADYTEERSEKTCLKIDLDRMNAYVAEGFYYDSSENEKLNELYNNSVLPVREYQLGMYRNPECLIVNTILPDCIEICDSTMDEPLLYTSSEALYLDRLFEEARNDCEDFRDLALAAYYDFLAASDTCWAKDQIGFRKIYRDGKRINNIVLLNIDKKEHRD